MTLYLECITCTVKQLTEAARRFIPDEQERYRVIAASMSGFSAHLHADANAPILTASFFDKIKVAAGVEDLYAAEKEFFNREMADLEAEFRRLITDSEDPLKTALCLSAAANIIDFGTAASVDKSYARQLILDAAGTERDFPAVEALRQELAAAETLLYVGDNCGEVVLDKLVLETLRRQYPRLAITFAVRDVPILNDVTRKEAEEVGIPAYARVISSGSRLPGVVLSQCTSEFQRLYRESDVVILKGMGNLETASAAERKAFFIFMVKCDLMCRLMETKLHDIFIVKGNYLDEKNRRRAEK
ncbi:DUF89 family protein [Heliobacterium gestii]|uniref:DUF89 family protein n=1 Tax=Heliomicrobium gestii TaxID=2699 RepID=A0A845LEA7_HELGE|nr:ARMT1-like domain-containing protein [Heliomicrobium gestii]MBM7868338.1 uncharacterized protein with ATP-grasp and redox domains [Heliomicrobium gestii]MZP44508.1 DUF89 family protein [Heliomicrobium gestii]